MPELLLRDEHQAMTKLEAGLPSMPKGGHIDTSAALQYYEYFDYLVQHGEIGAFIYKSGKEEEDIPEYIVSGELSTPERRWTLSWGREWPYLDQAILIPGTASEPSIVELYEVKYAQLTKATIATVLSQAAEYFGYALPRQLGLSIEPPAFKLLEDLTLTSLTKKVLDTIALEKRRGAPIRSVSITLFKDPEAANFEELVVKVRLDCDSDTALRIWDDLSENIEYLKRDLSSHEIKVLDERLGLDCEW
jgi:hypothetical protein